MFRTVNRERQPRVQYVQFRLLLLELPNPFCLETVPKTTLY